MLYNKYHTVACVVIKNVRDEMIVHIYQVQKFHKIEKYAHIVE